jgi:hypothetical protein
MSSVPKGSRKALPGQEEHLVKRSWVDMIARMECQQHQYAAKACSAQKSITINARRLVANIRC